MLGLCHNLETLDEGTLGIFGEGFVADDLAFLVYGHDTIRRHYIPTSKVDLEAGTEAILVNQTYLHFRRATSQRDESANTKLEEFKGSLVTVGHDKNTVLTKDSLKSLIGQYLIVSTSVLQERFESHGGIVHPTIARDVLL